MAINPNHKKLQHIIEQSLSHLNGTSFIRELKSSDVKNYNAYINIQGNIRTLSGHVLANIKNNKKLKTGSNNKKDAKKVILILEHLNKHNTDYSLAFNKNEKGSLFAVVNYILAMPINIKRSDKIRVINFKHKTADMAKTQLKQKNTNINKQHDEDQAFLINIKKKESLTNFNYYCLFQNIESYLILVEHEPFLFLFNKLKKAHKQIAIIEKEYIELFLNQKITQKQLLSFYSYHIGSTTAYDYETNKTAFLVNKDYNNTAFDFKHIFKNHATEQNKTDILSLVTETLSNLGWFINQFKINSKSIYDPNTAEGEKIKMAFFDVLKFDILTEHNIKYIEVQQLEKLLFHFPEQVFFNKNKNDLKIKIENTILKNQTNVNKKNITKKL